MNTTPETKTFRGRSLEEVLPQVRTELGPDAIVLRRREGLAGGVAGFFQRSFVEVEARGSLPDESRAGGPQRPRDRRGPRDAGRAGARAPGLPVRRRARHRLDRAHEVLAAAAAEVGATEEQPRRPSPPASTARSLPTRRHRCRSRRPPRSPSPAGLALPAREIEPAAPVRGGRAARRGRRPGGQARRRRPVAPRSPPTSSARPSRTASRSRPRARSRSSSAPRSPAACRCWPTSAPARGGSPSPAPAAPARAPRSPRSPAPTRRPTPRSWWSRCARPTAAATWRPSSSRTASSVIAAADAAQAARRLARRAPLVTLIDTPGGRASATARPSPTLAADLQALGATEIHLDAARDAQRRGRRRARGRARAARHHPRRAHARRPDRPPGRAGRARDEHPQAAVLRLRPRGRRAGRRRRARRSACSPDLHSWPSPLPSPCRPARRSPSGCRTSGRCRRPSRRSTPAMLTVALAVPDARVDRLDGSEVAVECTSARGIQRFAGRLALRGRSDVFDIELGGDCERIQRREWARVGTVVPIRVAPIDEPDLVAGETSTLNLSGGGVLIRDPWRLPMGIDARVEIVIDPTPAADPGARARRPRRRARAEGPALRRHRAPGLRAPHALRARARAGRAADGPRADERRADHRPAGRHRPGCRSRSAPTRAPSAPCAAPARSAACSAS